MDEPASLDEELDEPLSEEEPAEELLAGELAEPVSEDGYDAADSLPCGRSACAEAERFVSELPWLP